MQVRDLSGNDVDIFSLWEKRKVVCGFLRHVGCRFCWSLAKQLNEIHDVLKENQIQLICIILANTQQGIQFKKDLDFKGELYTLDSIKDSLTLYNNFKLKYENEILKTLSEQRVLEKIKITNENKLEDHPYYAEDKVLYSQDIKQLDGVFVLGMGNQCDYAYKADFVGDHPLNSDILKAALGKNVKGKEIYHEVSQYWSKILNVEKRFKEPKFNLGAIFDKSFYLFLSLMVLSTYYNKQIFFLVIFLIIIKENKRIFKLLIQNQIPKLVLMNPQQIDKMILESNLIKCDCSPILNKIQKNIEQKINHNNRKTSEQIEQQFQCENCQEYQKILCYLREFLSKPHPLVGREGPVCPFVPGSLKMNSIYLSVVKTDQFVDKNYIIQVVKNALIQFPKLLPTDNRSKIYKTIILIFPNIKSNQCAELIDGVQKQLKASFIKKGLMIGEFHSINNSCGLRNESFYPLRTPIPCLAIRHMVGTDIAFMSPSDCDVKTRIQYLQSYIENFNGDKHRQKDIQTAKETLDQLLQK